MKVFIAAGIYPPEVGGPATYAKLLEERLPARGFGVSVLPFSRVRRLPKVLRHVVYFVLCLGYAAGADVVYAQDTLSVGLPAALAAMLTGKKFVVRVPGDYAWEQARQRFGVSDELDEFQTRRYGGAVGRMRALQRFVVRRARLVVAPSAYMQNIAQGWGARNVHVVYSSIEAPEAAPVNRPGGFLVVSSGRPVPWKGFEALARVVAREPSWHLHIAQGVSRQEALGWAKAADVYVLNSTYEGLSHALVEAMTLGTPVVATRVGGNAELIESGTTGLLVPAKDAAALFAALKEVQGNPAAARGRAAAARERAQDFTIDKTLDVLCGLLNSL